MKKFRRSIVRITDYNTIIYLLLLFIAATFVFTFASLKKYLCDPNFTEGITVEAFGMLFDIFVLGVLFSIFNKFAENKRDIKRYSEEIDFFRGWKSEEAMYRTVGNIKRLIKLKANKSIFLERCYLENADLKGLELNDTNFQFSILINTNFNGSDLSNAGLNYANLTKANLSCAIMIGTHLRGVKLIGADLSHAILFGANLTGADLTRAKGLTFKQLKEVDSLFNVKGLPAKLRAELEEKEPYLFTNPDLL